VSDTSEPPPSRGGCLKPVLIFVVVVAVVSIAFGAMSSDDSDEGGSLGYDEALAFFDADEEWPLTTTGGEGHCRSGGAVTWEVDGTEYALNGVAKQDGYTDITPIWKDAGGGLRVSIGPLIDATQTLC